MKKHNTEFISEMKQKLLKEKGQLEAVLAKHAHKEHGSYQANYPEYERDEEVNAMESADAGSIQATTEAEEARLKNISAALNRIKEGTYGLTNSGELISEDRLRANPAANTIISS